MIYKILLVLCYWIYFAGEGVTEAMTFKANWTNWKINPRTYHIYRLLENAGLVGVILLLGFVCPPNWLNLSLLSAISGLVIYERIFCLVRYDNFWYQKTSKWLGIKHPPLWLEIVIFVVSFALLVHRICL